MKTSLSHLPQEKQDELKLITELIRERMETGMIILFGSYARGDWVDGPHQQGHGRLTIEKKSDYDILAITYNQDAAEDTQALQDLREEFNKLDLSAHVRLIAHDIKFVNEKLRDAQYFFMDIRKEGIALYDNKAFQFPMKINWPPPPGEREQIAQAHFDQWFTSAKDAYRQFQHALKDNSYKWAAFDLNQATEHAYKAVLLVFTNYTPNEHYLDAMEERAIRQVPDLYGVFPKDTIEQQQLFELLDYAYIGARYDPKYKISAEQLEQLSVCVRILHEIVERTCKEQIASLG